MPQNSEIIIANPEQRVSTKDIDDVVYQLQLAFGDGRLDEQDFDDRMTIAFKAKNREQLLTLLHDLTSDGRAILSPLRRPAATRCLPPKSVVFCSGNEVRGPFVMPEHYRIVAVMGGCILDLRQAQFAGPVTDIKITAIMGGVQIFVPKGVVVQLQGTPILGGFSQNITSDPTLVNAPIVRIHGLAVMGGVDVADHEENYGKYHHKLARSKRD